MISTQRESFSSWNHQSHLQRRAVLMTFTFVMPRPPLLFGVVIVDHLTRDASFSIR
ncbi:hypothetical protein IC582_020766 [Cucumis melo]